MKKTLSKYMTALHCDLSECAAIFYTASLSSLTRKQAKLEGWARVSLGRAMKHHGVTTEQAPDRFNGGRTVDLCPAHAPGVRVRRRKRPALSWWTKPTPSLTWLRFKVMAACKTYAPLWMVPR